MFIRYNYIFNRFTKRYFIKEFINHWNKSKLISIIFRIFSSIKALSHNTLSAVVLLFHSLTLFRMGFFGSAHWLGEGGKVPLPNICHIYPKMMKLGTIVPYLKKIQKIYETRDTSLEFCWYQHFFTWNQQIFLYQERQI